MPGAPAGADETVHSAGAVVPVTGPGDSDCDMGDAVADAELHRSASSVSKKVSRAAVGVGAGADAGTGTVVGCITNDEWNERRSARGRTTQYAFACRPRLAFAVAAFEMAVLAGEPLPRRREVARPAGLTEPSRRACCGGARSAHAGSPRQLQRDSSTPLA